MRDLDFRAFLLSASIAALPPSAAAISTTATPAPWRFDPSWDSFVMPATAAVAQAPVAPAADFEDRDLSLAAALAAHVERINPVAVEAAAEVIYARAAACGDYQHAYRVAEDALVAAARASGDRRFA